MKPFDLILIGAGAGILYALLDKQDIGIGKIYDTCTIKPGGRVDMVWARKVITDRKYLGASRPEMHKYADPMTVIGAFNLHSLEYGNWMNQEDRVNFNVGVGAGLQDMATVFGVPREKMGFKKTLSVAMGARGIPGSAAHYEPGRHVINQTKPHGFSGSYGHEYGHALDAELGKKYRLGDFASGGRSTRMSLDRDALNSDKSSVRYLMERVFQIFYYTDKGEYTPFALHQKELPEYWRRRTEVWARAIERYLMIKLHGKGITNRFLVKGGPQLNVQGMPPAYLVEKAMPYMTRLIKKAYR